MIIEIAVPQIGESITEVTLSTWLKENGAHVELDDAICEFESDKATIEVPAEKAGTLIWVAEEGEDLKIGAVFAKIDVSASGGGADKEETSTAQEEVPSEKEAKTTNQEATYATGHPSPAARKIMTENNLSAVKGTGKDGRITKFDAKKALVQAEQPVPKEAKVRQEEVAETKRPAVSVADFSRNTRVEKLSRMRRTIARRLVAAKNSTAMLTTFNEVDLSAVMKLRKTYQDDFVERYGVKLGFMSLFAKACAKVLMEMPQVNAQISEDGKHIQYHDYVDISIAISTPSGLVVPPVHNVESLNFAQVEKSIKALAVKAREGKLTLEEMTGGTFTITNGGVFGSLLSTPIINEPQSAILGMHGIQQRPVAVGDKVEIRPMMYVALSYDHRVIDGSSSVTFLVKVKKLLEDPTRLLLDL